MRKDRKKNICRFVTLPAVTAAMILGCAVHAPAAEILTDFTEKVISNGDIAPTDTVGCIDVIVVRDALDNLQSVKDYSIGINSTQTNDVYMAYDGTAFSQDKAIFQTIDMTGVNGYAINDPNGLKFGQFNADGTFSGDVTLYYNDGTRRTISGNNIKVDPSTVATRNAFLENGNSLYQAMSSQAGTNAATLEKNQNGSYTYTGYLPNNMTTLSSPDTPPGTAPEGGAAAIATDIFHDLGEAIQSGVDSYNNTVGADGKISLSVPGGNGGSGGTHSSTQTHTGVTGIEIEYIDSDLDKNTGVENYITQADLDNPDNEIYYGDYKVQPAAEFSKGFDYADFYKQDVVDLGAVFQDVRKDITDSLTGNALSDFEDQIREAAMSNGATREEADAWIENNQDEVFNRYMEATLKPVARDYLTENYGDSFTKEEAEQLVNETWEKASNTENPIDRIDEMYNLIRLDRQYINAVLMNRLSGSTDMALDLFMASMEANDGYYIDFVTPTEISAYAAPGTFAMTREEMLSDNPINQMLCVVNRKDLTIKTGTGEVRTYASMEDLEAGLAQMNAPFLQAMIDLSMPIPGIIKDPGTTDPRSIIITNGPGGNTPDTTIGGGSTGHYIAYMPTDVVSKLPDVPFFNFQYGDITFTMTVHENLAEGGPISTNIKASDLLGYDFGDFPDGVDPSSLYFEDMDDLQGFLDLMNQFWKDNENKYGKNGEDGMANIRSQLNNLEQLMDKDGMVSLSDILKYIFDPTLPYTDLFDNEDWNRRLRGMISNAGETVDGYKVEMTEDILDAEQNGTEEVKYTDNLRWTVINELDGSKDVISTSNPDDAFGIRYGRAGDYVIQAEREKITTSKTTSATVNRTYTVYDDEGNVVYQYEEKNAVTDYDAPVTVTNSEYEDMGGFRKTIVDLSNIVADDYESAVQRVY